MTRVKELYTQWQQGIMTTTKLCKRIAELEQRLERMKCCQNCDNNGGRASRCGKCVRIMFVPDADSIDHWTPIKEAKA